MGSFWPWKLIEALNVLLPVIEDLKDSVSGGMISLAFENDFWLSLLLVLNKFTLVGGASTRLFLMARFCRTDNDLESFEGLKGLDALFTSSSFFYPYLAAQLIQNYYRLGKQTCSFIACNLVMCIVVPRIFFSTGPPQFVHLTSSVICTLRFYFSEKTKAFIFAYNDASDILRS